MAPAGSGRVAPAALPPEPPVIPPRASGESSAEPGAVSDRKRGLLRPLHIRKAVQKGLSP